MSPAPFPVVAECEYQQPCHRQRHADQQPQAWRVCTRVGQLRRFTVQNGKGNCVAAGCIARCVFGDAIVYLVLAVLGKFDINRLGQQVVPRVCFGLCQPVSTGFQICEQVICNPSVCSGCTG